MLLVLLMNMGPHPVVPRRLFGQYRVDATGRGALGPAGHGYATLSGTSSHQDAMTSAETDSAATARSRDSRSRGYFAR
jgi:hypothetical protein